MNKEVDSYIEQTKEPFNELLKKLRTLIFEVFPSAQEQIKWSRPVYQLERDFCYLQANKSHVNLGFMAFQQIDDPENLLQGTGKSMRHLKFKRLEDLNDSVVKKMIRQAGT